MCVSGIIQSYLIRTNKENVMGIEKRDNGIIFIDAGNLPDLLEQVVDKTLEGYKLSKINEHVASGSFGHFTCGMYFEGLPKTKEDSTNVKPTKKKTTRSTKLGKEAKEA